MLSDDELVNAGAAIGWALSKRTDPEVFAFARAVERVAYERAAIAAWTAGMNEHNRRGGMPYDCREVGSACAAAIRALGRQHEHQ